MANSHIIGMPMSKEGFHKWVRLPIDDLPLIRPAKRHMLSQMTGGLQELYSQVKKSRSRPGSSQKESPLQSCLKRVTASSGNFERKLKAEASMYSQDSKSFNHEDDLERRKFPFENEDCSIYTDEEGEFVPSQDMPLLAHRYKYVNVLARGQSALIIKALDTFAKNKPIAIKVLHRVYKPIGSQEADILIELDRSDPWCHVPFSRLKNQFIYGPHYCLVFECLSATPLYTHYKQKNIKGTESIPQIQNLCIKLLSVLGFLHKQNVIHADFKPENILLKDENDMNSVTVIDFGNSLRNTEEELSLYYSDFELQTLLYRAPEVIFGLRFSLQIDLWSLGCLLAEGFIGQPLFIGKTKHDMLQKMSKLLGPFPKEFSCGDCAHRFKEFIGTPLSQYQRVENLKKKLNCSNINFLLLLERLLTYSPERRINPFDAASHSFVAKISPFLYLSSAGEKSYPCILLNNETYPHSPIYPPTSQKDEKLVVTESRSRLAMYSKGAKAEIAPTRLVEAKLKTESSSSCSIDSKPKMSQPPPLKKADVASHASYPYVKDHSEMTAKLENSRHQERNDFQNNLLVSHHEPQPTYKDSPSMRSPVGDIYNDKQSNGSPEMQHSFTSESSLQSPVTSPSAPFNTVSQPLHPITTPINNSSLEITRQGGVSSSSKPVPESKTTKDQPPGDISRTDVKQTLKDMGLRCEDFTISVYSKEQAHAILRKQGVEVTNHNQNKLNVPKPPNRLPKVAPNLLHPSVSVVRREQQTKPVAAAAAPLPKPTPEEKQEDDDDCIILDPPEGSKKPPPPPPLTSTPQRRLPQQFQLLGTTVQVSRGAKRPLRGGMSSRMPSKRGRPSYFYPLNEGRPPVDDNSEASVQDTLNRLKNYNISITCKRNTALLPHPHHRDDDEDDNHSDDDSLSEEEQDLARFLECEIKEKLPDDDDDDGPSAESHHHEERHTNVAKNEVPDTPEEDPPTNEDKDNNPEDSSPTPELDGHANAVTNGEDNNNHPGPIETAAEDAKNELPSLSPSIDDEDINEELEKELLEAANFGKEIDDAEDDGLDSLEKEL